MLTIKQIDSELIKSDSPELPDDFVAVGVHVDQSGIASHAALIIGNNHNYYIFHYTSTDVILTSVPKGRWYFHKVLSCIHPEFTTAFYAHCKIIHRTANPKYGYFYPGSYYDKNGTYFSESGMPEFMTCVGFCINVVLGFLETKEYIKYEDWDEQSNILDNNYFTNFIAEHNVDPSDIDHYKIHLRRITPAEYLSSSYIDVLPVSKQAVDEILSNVEAVLKTKRTLQSNY